MIEVTVAAVFIVACIAIETMIMKSSLGKG